MALIRHFASYSRPRDLLMVSMNHPHLPMDLMTKLWMVLQGLMYRRVGIVAYVAFASCRFVVHDVSMTGAGDWPYPYPWGDRRFDLRCTAAGMTIVRLRYKRSWEERYSWESRLNIYVLANP